MKLFKVLPVVLAAVSLLSGCKKDDTPEYDYMVFGWYGGWASFVHMYKIEDGVLCEDTSGTFPSIQPFEGSYVSLPNVKYTLAKDLVAQIPAQLLNEPSGALGIPNGGDGGGMYVEVKINGTVQYWHMAIFYNESGPYGYLIDFQNILRERIDAINR